MLLSEIKRKPLCTEDILPYLKFHAEIDNLSALWRVCERWIIPGVTPVDAYYEAYRSSHGNSLGIFPCVGSLAFSKIMKQACHDSSAVIRSTLNDFVCKSYRSSVMVHEDIDYIVNPVTLLDLARGTSGVRRRVDQSKLVMHAERKLAIANQFAAIALAEPIASNDDDLREIYRLNQERVFRGGADHEFHVLYRLDPENKNRVKEGSIKIFKKRNLALEMTSRLDNLGHQSYLTDPLACYVVKIHKIRIYFTYRPRVKQLRSTLHKLERKDDPMKALKDLRAWLNQIVAVEDEHGKIRSPTIKDVELFWKYCKRVLWQHPFTVEEVKTSTTPDRFTGKEVYRDYKLRGRFIHVNERIATAGPVEQMIVTVEQYVSSKSSLGEDNHGARRFNQVYQGILPVWFPEVCWDDEDIEAECWAYYKDRHEI